MKTILEGTEEKWVELAKSLEHVKEELLMSQRHLNEVCTQRRKLHIDLQDLRGNIRVFVRVRKPIEADGVKPLSRWLFIDQHSLEVSEEELMPGARKEQKKCFAFDFVFEQSKRCF